MKDATNITLEDKIYLLGKNDIEVFTTAIISISIEGTLIRVKTKAGYEPLFSTDKGLKSCSEVYTEIESIHYYTELSKAVEKSIERAKKKQKELMQEIEKLNRII